MKSVAVIGASRDRNKYGNKAVRAYKTQGWLVYPVNPRGGEIEGLTVYPDLASVPERPNVVSVYLPPEISRSLLPEIAEKGCDELLLNPGADSPAALEEAERLELNAIVACSIVGVGMNPALL